MHKQVLENLVESFQQPQIINTSSEDIDLLFDSGHKLLSSHVFTTFNNVECYIVEQLEEFDYRAGDYIWVNLKGNIDIGDVSTLMKSSVSVLRDAIITLTAAKCYKEEIELSTIISKKIKTWY